MIICLKKFCEKLFLEEGISEIEIRYSIPRKTLALREFRRAVFKDGERIMRRLPFDDGLRPLHPFQYSLISVESSPVRTYLVVSTIS